MKAKEFILDRDVIFLMVVGIFLAVFLFSNFSVKKFERENLAESKRDAFEPVSKEHREACYQLKSLIERTVNTREAMDGRISDLSLYKDLACWSVHQ